MDPESGISLQAVNDFDFIANTVNSTQTTEVTLTNQSTNTTESSFEFNFNSDYFTIDQGTGNNACVTNGNKIMSVLGPKDSCNFKLTYNNSTKVSKILEDMSVIYLYHGDRPGTASKSFSYETTQATASLSFVPLSHDFGTIIANNEESKIFDYKLINAGPDVAIDVTPSITASSQEELRVGLSTLPFIILPSSTCGNPLNAGESCIVSVKFGATPTPLVPTPVVTNVSADLVVDYKSSTDKSSTPETTKATAIGATRLPNSANPVVTNVVYSPAASGGDGKTSDSAFAIQQDTANQKVTLTYQNTGNVDANNFTVSNDDLTGYENDGSGTCTDFTLQKNSGNSCTMVYKMIVSSPSVANLDLTSATGSWDDERQGQETNRPIYWVGNDSPIIYANIYEAASVTASLEDTNGQPMLEPYEMNVNTDFKIKLTLSGGYNVPDTFYTVQAPSGFTPTSQLCPVSSNNNSCTVTFTAPSTSMYGAEIEVFGNPTPTPNRFSINVIAPWIFVSQSSPQGDMFSIVEPYSSESIGVKRADMICQHDAESFGWISSGTGAARMSWKAMLVDGVNRQALPTKKDWVFKSNTQYKDIRTGLTIGTTNSLSVFTFSLMSTFGEGYDWQQLGNNLNIFTGLQQNWYTLDTCKEWSDINASGDAGSPIQDGKPILSSGSISAYSGGICDYSDNIGDSAWRIVCVSQ